MIEVIDGGCGGSVMTYESNDYEFCVVFSLYSTL